MCEWTWLYVHIYCITMYVWGHMYVHVPAYKCVSHDVYDSIGAHVYIFQCVALRIICVRCNSSNCSRPRDLCIIILTFTHSPTTQIYHQFCMSSWTIRWPLSKPSVLNSLPPLLHPGSSGWNTITSIGERRQQSHLTWTLLKICGASLKSTVAVTSSPRQKMNW